MFESFNRLVREIYQTNHFIPLHEPRFLGKEKQYLLNVIDSGFVSSVGAYVTEFETKMAEFCGTKYAIATVNGTAALHIALLLAGVKPDEQVITQAVSFVATSNAIHYCGAEPIFIDVDPHNLGMSPVALANFLAEYAELRGDGGTWNKLTNKRISACLPMHSFGHAVDIAEILRVCQSYDIPVIEDAAEALGSICREGHCGSKGLMGILSFNGNKIMTTGGGGMILTNNEAVAVQARHLTTTAKVAHPWQFDHDQVGYNYRMPNLNAALGLAQLEQLPMFLQHKRALAQRYIEWAKCAGVGIVVEPAGTQSNYWLNSLLLDNLIARDDFLRLSNAADIMTRPLWKLLSKLPMYQHCQTDGLVNSHNLAERLVNIPSSVVL